MANGLREMTVTDANSQVARAIRDELCRLGLVSPDRADALEKAVSAGSIKAEDWYLAIESSLPAQQGAADADKQLG
jgi:hypothetical protein